MHAQASRPWFLLRLTPTATAVLTGVCCVLFALAAYWAVLFEGYGTQRRSTEEQTWLRAGQMAQAVAVQAQTLLSGLDYTVQGLAAEYEAGNGAAFRRAVGIAFGSYPAGAFVQIAVADAAGNVVYSSLEQPGEPLAPVSIGDREHFQVHARREAAGTFVGRPVQGRVSGQWTIQLSRALHRNGDFTGVLVLSLSPDYISRYFQAIFDGPEDVIGLLRDDGAYLARSRNQEALLGRSVPAQWVGLAAPAQTRGRFEAASPADGVRRLYAWSRVAGYPVIANVGLDRRAVFEPLEAEFSRTVVRNGMGSALIFLGTLLTAWLALQRQRSELLLRQGERRFTQLVRQVPGGLFQFCTDAGGEFQLLFTSPGFFAVHGIAPRDGLPQSEDFARHVHPDDLPELLASLRASVAAEGVWEHKYRVLGPGGEVRWLQGHARPQRDEDGSLLWHGYVHDVTRDQALQEAVCLSEERLRRTVAAVRDGLWEWDCSSGRVEWDARCYQMLGFEDRAFALDYEGFLSRVHPADRARALEQLRRHMHGQEDFRVEVRMRTAADAWRWIESRGEVTARDADGRPQRMLGTHSDIQQRVEQARLIQALLDRGSVLIIMSDVRRNLLYANERAAQAFGLVSGPQPAGLTFRALHVSDESFAEFGRYCDLLKAQGTVRVEWALRVPGPQAHWFDVQGALLDPGDAEGNVVWTMTDTDARHRAEAALAEAQRRLEAIIDRFPAGILVTDAPGRQVLAANRMLVSALGLALEPGALVGMPVAELAARLPEAIAGAIAGTVAATAAQGGPASGKSLQLLPDGRCFEVEGLALRDKGRTIGHCWVLHDVTERRQRESQLKTLALTDALTGVPNRRAFLERLDMELSHLRSGLSEQATLVMLDIDLFKRVNDTYGHAVGDLVLKDLAATVAQELRKEDMVGRIGGEEFAVLLSAASDETGYRRAERLREAVAARAVGAEGAGALRYTISLGVYGLRRGDASAQACLERADAALYFSKRNGRNQTTRWREDLPEIVQA